MRQYRRRDPAGSTDEHQTRGASARQASVARPRGAAVLQNPPEPCHFQQGITVTSAAGNRVKGTLYGHRFPFCPLLQSVT